MALAKYTITIRAVDTPLLVGRLAQLLAKRGCIIRHLETKSAQNRQIIITLTIEQSSAIPKSQIVGQIQKLIDVDDVN